MYACRMRFVVGHSKEVGHANTAPVKLRQNRLKAMSTSEPAAIQGILTVVSRVQFCSFASHM